jgi:hypothetical protein
MGSAENPVFKGCSLLKTLNIANNVTKIPSYAFKSCNNITSITTHAQTAPVCGTNSFENVPITIPVNIPCLSYLSYTNATEWKKFTNFVVPGNISYYNYTKQCYLPYTDNNFPTPINNPGVYYTSIPNANNCDSIICLTLLANPHPQICMISVNNRNQNEIVCKKHTANASYNIYRETLQTGNYELAGTLACGGASTWVDVQSNARIRSYRYKISGVDVCGKEGVQSPAHKTMHLTINAGVGNSWNLIWTAYEGTEYSTYNIYRSSGETMGELQLIGTMPGGNTSFSDFSAPQGYVYYMVEILMNETCVGKGSSIKSNVATNNPNVGINEQNPISGVSVYPNPTTGELRITNYELRITSLEVFDVYGRALLSHKSPVSSETTLDISHLAAGLYFVKIKTEAGEVVKKVTKQ